MEKTERRSNPDIVLSLAADDLHCGEAVTPLTLKSEIYGSFGGDGTEIKICDPVAGLTEGNILSMSI